MMTSQVLRSVDFIKSQERRYLEKGTSFFLQIKKFINYIKGYFIAKNSFVAEVTFNYTFSSKDIFKNVPRVLILIMTLQPLKLMEWSNRTEHDFSMK